ncbi:MAG TPA: hypothetical protein PKE29_06245 [Phycisphaerales bacterium]|nr:hypothetical protein [Phycisphaerales bacterium]
MDSTRNFGRSSAAVAAIARTWRWMCAAAVLAGGIGLARPVAAQTLDTIYTGGNGGGSLWTVYFDLTINTPVIIQSFDVNCSTAAGTAFTLDVWITAAGDTFAPNMTNPGAWTLVASGPGTTAGAGQHSTVDTSDFTLNPGTYGVGIRYIGVSSNYTNGTASNTTYSTPEMTLVGGASQVSTAGPFTGAINTPRIWNGSIHYVPANPNAEGACCFNTGSCTFGMLGACTSGGGTFRGEGVACASVVCPVQGACCHPTTGVCALSPGGPGGCAAGTSYQGDGSACTPGLCGQGACCNDTNGGCSLSTQSGCPGGSTFQSVGTACTPTNPCPQPPPPANDTCGAPDDLNTRTFPYTVSVSNTGATPDPVQVACNTGSTTAVRYGVWYKFDAPAGGGQFTFTEASTQDVVWAVFNVGPGGACPDAATASTTCTLTDTAQSLALTGGSRYYFLVGQQGASTVNPTVSLALTFNFFPPPANDDCASATTIFGGGAQPGPFFISTIGGLPPTDNSPIACTASVAMNNDVWYKWTATADGAIALSSRASPAAYSGRYAIYDGGPSPGTCPSGGAGLLACNAFSTTGVTAVVPNASVVAGNVYYFQFAAQTANSTGAALIDFDFAPAATGGCCASGVCTVRTPGECAAAGGAYLGDNALCSTATGGVSSYSGSGGAIPDFTGGVEGLFNSSITVADPFAVADVEVDIAMAHTFQGDLIITLDNGSRTVFLNNRGRRGETTVGSLTADFLAANTYTWSDAGTQSIFEATLPTITSLSSGVYRPAGVHGLSRGFQRTFNGMPAAGAWTLTIRDHAGADVGAVASWTLRLTQGGAGPCVAPAGVCCRGATCTTAITTGAACTGSLAGALAGATFATGAACNAGAGTTSPCCYADYNKVNGVSVQDIFDFLNDWLAGRPFARVGGDGTTGVLDVQNIFDFLNAWLAGGCAP